MDKPEIYRTQFEIAKIKLDEQSDADIEKLEKEAEEWKLKQVEKTNPSAAAGYKLGDFVNTVGTVASFLPGKPYKGPAILAASGLYDLAAGEIGSGDPTFDQQRTERGKQSLEIAGILAAAPATVDVASRVIPKVAPGASKVVPQWSKKPAGLIAKSLADTIGGNIGSAIAYGVTPGGIGPMIGGQLVGQAIGNVAERKAVELGQKYLPKSVQTKVARAVQYAFPNVYGKTPPTPTPPVVTPEVKPIETKAPAGRPRPSPGRGRFKGGFAAIPAITDPVGELVDIGVGKLLGGSSMLGGAVTAPLFINQSAGGGEEQWLATRPSDEEVMKQAEELAKQKEKEQEEKKKEMSRTGMRPLPDVRPVEPMPILNTNIGLKEQVKQLVNETTKLPRSRSGGPVRPGISPETEAAHRMMGARRAIARGESRRISAGEVEGSRVRAPGRPVSPVAREFVKERIKTGNTEGIPQDVIDDVMPELDIAPTSRVSPPSVPVKPPEAEPVRVPVKPVEVTPEPPAKVIVRPEPVKVTDTGIAPQPVVPERVPSKTVVTIDTPQPQPQPQPQPIRPRARVAIDTGVKPRPEEPDTREDELLKLVNARLAKALSGIFDPGRPGHYYTSKTPYSEPMSTEQEEELERRRFYRASLMHKITEAFSQQDIEDIQKELVAREKARLPDFTDIELLPAREVEKFKVDEPVKPETSKKFNLDMYLNKIRELRSRFSPHHFWQMPTDTAIALGYPSETKGTMPYGYRQP